MIEPGEMMQAEVLTLLRRRREALSAYDVLRELRGRRPKLAPTTIYRALGVLIESGRVHRLESLNAYIARKRTDHRQSSFRSICDDYEKVEERKAPGLLEKLSDNLEEAGFTPQRHVIEVHGICTACQPNQPEPAHSPPQ